MIRTNFLLPMSLIMRAYSLSNIKFFHLGAFTLLCPKGPGYSVKNNSVVGKENILRKGAVTLCNL